MKLTLVFLALFPILFLTSTWAQSKTVKPPANKATPTKGVVQPGAKATIKPVTKAPIASKERLVEITTDLGTMVAKLYDSTPLHRDNFVRLVEQQFYDSLLFHRVIPNFMVQGGDPTSKYASESMTVGSGSAPGERIPAEFKPHFIHKKGALAAARDNNPAKASSNCQFYIVHGRKYPLQELENVFTQQVRPNAPGYSYSPNQKEIYTRIGGVPSLDQNYTVFGEVISGLNVIDKIAALEKGQGDRPLKNIRMKIRLLN